MKKLSEFPGQEHITSVLRASIIKNTPVLRVSVAGDDFLAQEIKEAYWKALNCGSTVRGNACGECVSCSNFVFSSIDLDFRTTPFEGSLDFQLKTAMGDFINPDVLGLLIYAFQSTKADVMKHAKHLSTTLLFDEFVQQFTDILTNILYLKNNVEVKELEKAQALRALAVRMSVFNITAAIRILWDSQSKSALSDPSRIVITSLLISEALQPTPEPEATALWADNTETPIKVIEDDNLEQPLDLAQMLRIAHE